MLVSGLGFGYPKLLLYCRGFHQTLTILPNERTNYFRR